MARPTPTRDDIDVALDVIDWLNANAADPGNRDEISHVAHLLEQETR